MTPRVSAYRVTHPGPWTVYQPGSRGPVGLEQKVGPETTNQRPVMTVGESGGEHKIVAVSPKTLRGPLTPTSTPPTSQSSPLRNTIGLDFFPSLMSLLPLLRVPVGYSTRDVGPSRWTTKDPFEDRGLILPDKVSSLSRTQGRTTGSSL